MVRASSVTSEQEAVKTPHRIELCDHPPVRPIRNYRKRRVLAATPLKTENTELKTEPPSKITRSKPLKSSNGIANMTNGLALRPRPSRTIARATSHKLTEYFKEELKSPILEHFKEELKSPECEQFKKELKSPECEHFKKELKSPECEHFKNELEPPTSPPPQIQKTVKQEAKIANGNTNLNHKLTEYFPVRRSVRKTSKCVMAEKMRDLERAVREQKEDGLAVKYFDGKGRGIVATRAFNRGQYVVEYAGELVGISEAREREARYAADPEAGCYMYYFRLSDQQYCIDATAESGRLGRLVNHSRNGNLHTKALWVDRPRLVLLAGQDISPGEELTYDYGDRSKESLLHHPWLAL